MSGRLLRLSLVVVNLEASPFAWFSVFGPVLSLFTSELSVGSALSVGFSVAVADGFIWQPFAQGLVARSSANTPGMSMAWLLHAEEDAFIRGHLTNPLVSLLQGCGSLTILPPSLTLSLKTGPVMAARASFISSSLAILPSSPSLSIQLTTGFLWSRTGKMEVIFCSISLNLDAVSSFKTNLRVSCSFPWIKVTLKEMDILNLVFCFFTSSLLLRQVNVSH